MVVVSPTLRPAQRDRIRRSVNSLLVTAHKGVVGHGAWAVCISDVSSGWAVRVTVALDKARACLGYVLRIIATKGRSQAPVGLHTLGSGV